MMYFKSETAEYIFYLVEMDGEQRANKLKIDLIHYRHKEIATKWKDNILKIITKEDHPMKDLAIEKLNEIYNEMIM